MSTRPGPAVYVAGLVALLLFAGFMALGIWQVERRAWKLQLIDQVAARAHAAPVAPPGPASWAAITATTDAYRRIRLDGTLDNSRETLVRAATALGSGSSRRCGPSKASPSSSTAAMSRPSNVSRMTSRPAR
jgi:surfeit locus 1 family protein